MKPKSIILALLLAAVLLLAAGCSEQPETPPTPTTTPAAGGGDVAATPPARGTVILADGVLRPRAPALPVGFATGGELLALAVAPGDVVAAGDLLGTLDDADLRANVVAAEQQVGQAEISLAQAQLALENLLTWEADPLAVAVAEANLAAAEAALAGATAQDDVAGANLTASRISVDQAVRALADVQEVYDTAFDPAREWELGAPFYKERLEAEREGATRALQQAQESLQIARANYAVALATLNDNRAVDAAVALANAEQAVAQATTGPRRSEIRAAELQVDQAQLSLLQAQTGLAQAQATLPDVRLLAPMAGTVLSVSATPGALVGAGTPVLVLLPAGGAAGLQFHTTNLSERDLAAIAPGLPVAITLKAYPAMPLDGVVARVVPQAGGLVGDAATFTVVVDIAATDLMLLEGMTGRVEIRNTP